MIDALITGANGFIGKALSDKLASMGQSTHLLTHADGDVAERATWQDLPPASCVYHLAGRSFVPDSWQKGSDFLRTNLGGTEQAIDYCRKHKAHLVFASTYVYGAPQSLPVSETHQAQPNNPYAHSKYLAEQLCEFAATYHNITATTLRLFNVFGAEQAASFLIPTILDQIKAGKEIRVKDLSPKRDYIYLDDVVDAFICAGQQRSGYAICNIGSGKSHSVQDVIDVIQTAAGTNLPIHSEQEIRQQEISDVIADITQANSLLGWQPNTSFSSGMQRILAKEARA